ncbi:glycosyltransferase [Cellulosimicrobium arenosum]|uniref:Glycosyltransferase family 1 protein n=1 Tax=Cellulosimicrobium arenosum TaxID=2708133 RepID=A0A927G860_9MICO|nr:glycosyltransferase [Cellulosimicrobium arenosum]MBD8078485.1 glycosyltransferase family 1 protein [Cellulosimicrobium arenosum]
MASVLLCSTPVHAHVTPLLAVTRSLVERGHDVRFLTGARFADAVTAAGAQHLPLPAEADFDDRDLAGHFPGREGRTGLDAIRYDMLQIFVGPGLAQHRAVLAALAERPTDVVLVEPLFLGATALAATPAERRPSLVALGIFPLGLTSAHTAPFGLGVLPASGRLGVVRNRVLQRMVARTLAPAQEAADGLVRAAGERPLDGFFLSWPAHADAIAQLTVEEFEYPRPDVTTPVRFVGPPSASGGAGGPALPAWWGDLDGSRPVVHVTQGTVANEDLGQLILPTIRALADEDVLVVAATGGRPVEALGTLPANARAAEYLPYDALLPLTSAYATNGGYGGVHHALRHGVPIVVAGKTEDKAEVAARVAWSGAGVRLRTNQPRPAQVRRAVRRVLDDAAYAAASARIGERIAASPGTDGVVDVVEQLTHVGGARVDGR